MAIAKRTQVALGTVAVFVMAIFGLGVFSFTSITGRSGVTTRAESDSRVVELSFSPETVSGTVSESNVVVDVIGDSSAPVLGATLVFQFDPKLVTVTEVNSEGGAAGGAAVAFDFTSGLLTAIFKPGKAVALKGSRLASFLVDLVGPGTGSLELVPGSSEVTILNGGVIERKRPTSLGGVVFSISSP